MKKIGNTFGKGIKIGMLSAALAMGAVNTTACKLNDDVAVEVSTSTDLESFYFARHSFANEDVVNEVLDNDLSLKEKIAWANKHYTEIQDYMLPKAKDLLSKLGMENNGNNFLMPYARTRFAYYDGSYGNPGFHGNLVEDISYNRNYSALVGAIGAKFTSGIAKQEGREIDVADYENFENIYNVLALRSYNDSLGSQQGSTDFPFNQQRNKIETAVVNNRGSQAFSVTNAQDYDQIETVLKKALMLVAANTGVSLEILTDVVNMSLLNNSLWGARDYIGTQTNSTLSSNVGRVESPDFTTYGKMTTTTYTNNMRSDYGSQINQELREQQAAQSQENSL